MEAQVPEGFAEVTSDGKRGSLRFERQLSTTLADAWEVISNPERIARWFAPVTVEGTEWITYWDDGREFAKGKILQCEPGRLLEVSWIASDDAEPLTDTLLRLSIVSEGEGVLLVLEHEQLLAEDLTQYGPGWHTYLDRVDGSEPELDWSDRYAQLKPHYERAVTYS